MSEERLARVRVTNGLDVVYTDRYDGVPITLRPGQTEVFDLETAAHVWGWSEEATPESLARYIGRRQGWNSTAHLARDESGKTLAERMAAVIKFEPVFYKVVEADPDPNAPIAADPQPQPPSSITKRFEKLQARVDAALRS